jgi:hypothetical protein
MQYAKTAFIHTALKEEVVTGWSVTALALRKEVVI